MPAKKKVTDEVVKAKNLFDHIKAVTTTKNPKYWDTLSDNDKKNWSNYMIIRYMSMLDVELIDMLQPYIQDLPPEMLYNVLREYIPYYKGFIKYISAEKSSKYESWLVDVFVKHYNVSKKEVDNYLNILYITDNGKLHIKDVCQMYGVEEKKIKSLKLGI